MRIRINYTTAYDYTESARDVVQLLRVQPRSGTDQLVSRWRIDVDADGALRPGTDPFGNWTHLFTADGPVERLTLSVTGEVDTNEAHGAVRGFTEPLPPAMFLRATALTTPDPAITAFVRDLGDGPALDRLHDLNHAINAAMAFDAASTGTGTDAAAAFAQKSGVCQDYTHIFCTAARSIGIPARYVSGHYVRPEAQPAGHAWAEALIPDLGWVGFDPTNGISTTPAHVRVAVGLDYLDAAPVRGARRGGGAETMNVRVSAIDMAIDRGTSAAQSQSQHQQTQA
jgi:transglutaminase-like putative cysteine protease